MEQLTHIMVDIETYDVKPSAVILSIGAATLFGNDDFYAEIDPKTQPNRTCSDSTVNWWAAQGNPPINGTNNFIETMQAFATWVKARGERPVIWCKGTNFDVVILTHALESLNIPVPWKYNDVRDCRTVFKLAGINPVVAEHHALSDVYNQTDDLMKALVKLGKPIA